MSKERKREKNSVLLLLEHHSRERLQREKKTMMRARTCSVCVNAACAECININDVFCRKDAVKALFETAFLKRRKRRELTFFFHHKTHHEFSSHDLSFEKRKRDEKRKIFDEGSQKVKKLVFCGCLQRKERLTQKQHKTEGREKEKRNEKLCVFNVGVGRA